VRSNPTTTKMTGESNESPGVLAKQEHNRLCDEEAVTKVEDNTRWWKEHEKEVRGKDDSKVDSSEPIDDDSENTCSNVACNPMSCPG
jgi:hypothetical protein